MNIYILTGYNGDLLDPVLSFSYDEIYEKMNQQYHAVLDGVHQTSSEKECTWISANGATAVIYGEWHQWQITKLPLPIPDLPGNAEYPVIKELPKNPYLLSYFKHHGLSIGDSWNVTQYILWIDQKHDEFRRIRHLPEHIVLNNMEIHDFLHFINTDLKQEVF